MTGTASGRKPRNWTRVLGPQLVLERAASDGDEAGVRDPVDDGTGGHEEVGVALRGAKVRDGADQHLVGAHPEAGPLGPGVGARRSHRRGVDPVPDDARAVPDTGGQRVLHGRRHAQVHLGAAGGEPVCEAGQPGMAGPDIVLRDHYAWPPGRWEGPHRQSGTNGHERRMHVDEVEVVGVEHSAQPEDPSRVPRRGRTEAPNRPASLRLQAGSER
jgi:hypothetical protein